MSEPARINLAELRREGERTDLYAMCRLQPKMLLALIDAVEAAHAYATFDHRQPDSGTALRFAQALARFDFEPGP